MPTVSPARVSKVPSVRMFASCTPGLGQLMAEQLSALDDTDVLWTGNDGRSDLVSFKAASCAAAELSSRVTIAENFYVHVGHASRSDGDRPGWLAQRLCRNEQLRNATSFAGTASATATYRVIVRVLSERSFHRTELRRQLTALVGRIRPSWRHADPASNELWVCEYRPGLFVAGLRSTGDAHRHRGGRRVERAGALRPGFAGALVWLAGTPDGVLVDPCCGSGSVLTAAVNAGWTVVGFDIDPEAVVAAKTNLAGDALLSLGDARQVDLPDRSARAWVSNLPFGVRHSLPMDSVTWFRAVLGEAARVVQPAGKVVVLSAGIPQHAIPQPLQRQRAHAVRILGRAAVIDVFVTT